MIDFSNSGVEQLPFPHFRAGSVLTTTLEKDLYNWLETTTVWEFTQTEFYEQHEFSLLHVTLPHCLNCIVETQFVNAIREQMESIFKVSGLKLEGATVHKLTNGHRIGVHNDFVGKEETHRLLVQINAGWTEEKGGYLLLFNSQNAEDISNVILPLSNSAFGFEISEKSNHAVSTVYDFSRYTVVYTFKDSKE